MLGIFAGSVLFLCGSLEVVPLCLTLYWHCVSYQVYYNLIIQTFVDYYLVLRSRIVFYHL